MERFGLKLPDSLTSKFEKDSKHPIYELEIFPILLALRVWQRHFLDAQIVFYLDNDAARSRMIRAEGSTRLTQSLISEFVKLEKQLKVFPWFARVPTASNPADDASRLNFNTPWLVGVPKPDIVLPAQFCQWGM